MGSSEKTVIRGATSAMLRLLLLLAAICARVTSGSCLGCGATPCQTPACCESGQYTWDDDECPCCLKCVKARGQKCEAEIFGLRSSECDANLRCLRACAPGCNTKCVFPFTYKGQTFETCTTFESETKRPWCPTEVTVYPGVTPHNEVLTDPETLWVGEDLQVEMREGNITGGTWEYCEEGCPGTGTGQYDGLSLCCTGPSQVEARLAEQDAKLAAPLCTEERSAQRCGCTKEVAVKGQDGNLRGGCVPPPNVWARDESLAQGWCFLENVGNPQNATEHCFADAVWSVADGRFWSSLACIAEHNIKNKEDEPTTLLAPIIDLTDIESLAIPFPLEPLLTLESNESSTEGGLADPASEDCLTVTYKRCVFPFYHQNQLHRACTRVSGTGGAPGCPVLSNTTFPPGTSVFLMKLPGLHDRRGQGSNTQGHWEDCGVGCPVED